MSLTHISLSVGRGELIVKEGKYSLENCDNELMKSVPLYSTSCGQVLIGTQDEIFYSSTHKKRLLTDSTQATKPGFSAQEKEAVFHGNLE